MGAASNAKVEALKQQLKNTETQYNEVLEDQSMELYKERRKEDQTRAAVSFGCILLGCYYGLTSAKGIVCCFAGVGAGVCRFWKPQEVPKKKRKESHLRHLAAL